MRTYLAAVRPRVVLTLMAVHTLLVAFAGITGRGLWAPRIDLLFGVVGYVLAAALAFDVSREHTRSVPMRVAWLALSGNCVLWVVGKVTGGSVLYHLAPDVFTRPVLGLLMHLAVVPADVLLLIGVVSIWLAFRESGLGFRLRYTDYLWMALLVGSMTGILAFRGNLTEASSPYPGVHGLQQTGLVLLSFAAAASLVLRRFALDIGHSRLALVLQFLAVHAIARCVLVFLDAGVRSLGQPSAEVLAGIAAARTLAHWSITLAASYRAAMAVDAARQIVELEDRRPLRSESRQVVEGAYTK